MEISHLLYVDYTHVSFATIEQFKAPQTDSNFFVVVSDLNMSWREFSIPSQRSRRTSARRSSRL